MAARIANAAAPILAASAAKWALWTAVAVAALVLMAVAVTLLRRQLFKTEDVTDQPPFLLEDLRQMRDSGQISEQEYRKARDALTARLKQPPDGAGQSPAQRRGD
jgi:hypothetical protein